MMKVEFPYRNAVITYNPGSANEMSEAVMSERLCAARRAIDQAFDLDEPKDKGVDYDEGIDGDDSPSDVTFIGVDGKAYFPMPAYQCHKRVFAAKIIGFSVKENGVAALALSLSAHSKAYIETREGWTERFHGGDEDLGYYVQYEDGYTSWSPTQAFEDGYRRIT